MVPQKVACNSTTEKSQIFTLAEFQISVATKIPSFSKLNYRVQCGLCMREYNELLLSQPCKSYEPV